MAFNIQEFKSEISDRGGVATPNKFKVEFTLPPILTSTSNLNVAKKMQYWCDSAIIPGIQLSVHELRRYGYGAFERKPYAPLFTDLNITVINDAEGKNFNFWYNWFSNITHFESNRTISNTNLFEVSYKDDYATTMSITSYNNKGKAISKISLLEAYPIFMENIALNWGDTNNIMRIPITITFFTWSFDNVAT